MPKLKVLSGSDVVHILEQLGFTVTHQRGSHIKLSREVGERRQTLTIPLHDTLDRGTLKAIYNQASRYVFSDELRTFFYTD